MENGFAGPFGRFLTVQIPKAGGNIDDLLTATIDDAGTVTVAPLIFALAAIPFTAEPPVEGRIDS